MIPLSPDARHIADAKWQGFWMAAVIWLPLGALAGWLVHAVLSGARP